MCHNCLSAVIGGPACLLACAFTAGSVVMERSSGGRAVAQQRARGSDLLFMLFCQTVGRACAPYCLQEPILGVGQGVGSLVPVHDFPSCSDLIWPAILDHCKRENHIMDWDNARVIRAESNKYHRWIREAIEIRKRAPRTMNRDEGAYTLSHTWDVVLEKATDSRGRKLSLLSGKTT
ncbi:hypothetical protein DPX16_0381 [Anabarilius grahami]|uniref:Uncharacterized protein n=1 Tax=Anabarilius grahami TaxID=495550 RepID=A0A3N0Y4N6_ANAGA|nr:hypothetical protein DPX16_0381 [Anabarilius grahami]